MKPTSLVRVCLGGALLLSSGCAGGEPRKRPTPIDHPATIRRLASELLRPGTGEQASLRSEAANFFSDPKARALLRSTLEETPPQAQRDLISLAALSGRPEFIELLASEATQPLLSATSSPHRHGNAHHEGTSPVEDATYNAILAALSAREDRGAWRL